MTEYDPDGNPIKSVDVDKEVEVNLNEKVVKNKQNNDKKEEKTKKEVKEIEKNEKKQDEILKEISVMKEEKKVEVQMLERKEVKNHFTIRLHVCVDEM
jgi:hypothetical protein